MILEKNRNGGMMILIKVIEKLKGEGLKISTMESCTGGMLASEITNIEGSSEVFEFGAVTYSNFYKIKMGVNAEVIAKYSVYSMETAREMSRAISEFTGSDYGIGITGKLNREDENNLFGENNLVYISIYDHREDIFYDEVLEVMEDHRIENKRMVIQKVKECLEKILWK